MNLRRYTLTDEESALLADIVKDAMAARHTERTLRVLFDQFLSENNIEMSPSQRHRLLKSPTIGRYATTVVLYDFVVSTFVRHLQNVNRPNEYSGLIKRIESLIEMRNQIGYSSADVAEAIRSRMTLDDAVGKIPSGVEGLFFGYRCSSNVGGVVRFSIEFHPTGDPNVVTFVNEYTRYDDRWKVDGVGYFLEPTIYLVGHARNYKNDKTMGLRARPQVS